MLQKNINDMVHDMLSGERKTGQSLNSMIITVLIYVCEYVNIGKKLEKYTLKYQ